MVTLADIEKGIGAYLDSELMAQLPPDSIERAVVGTVAALYIKKKMHDLAIILDSPMAKELGIVGEDGGINLEPLKEEFENRMPPTGIVYDKGLVEKVFGRLRFQKEDVDKLYSYITKQEV